MNGNLVRTIRPPVPQDQISIGLGRPGDEARDNNPAVALRPETVSDQPEGGITVRLQSRQPAAGEIIPLHAVLLSALRMA